MSSNIDEDKQKELKNFFKDYKFDTDPTKTAYLCNYCSYLTTEEYLMIMHTKTKTHKKNKSDQEIMMEENDKIE